MSFAAFLIYIVFLLLRPFELYLPGLIPYRPMLILWLIAFMLALGRLFMNGKFAGRPAHVALMTLLFVAVALSSLARDGIGRMFESIMDFLPGISLMLLAMINLTSLARLKMMCMTVVVCVLVLCAGGIAAYHTGFMEEEFVLRQNTNLPENELTAPIFVDETAPPAQDKSGTAMWRVKAVGLLADPNDFSQVIVLCLPLLWLLYAQRGWIMRILLIGAPASVMIYTILLTQSRGALVGMAALIGLFLQRIAGTVVTMWAAGLSLVGLVGMTYGGGRGFSTEEESAAQRIDAWWEGINLLKAYPVFGAGFNNFTNHHYLTAHNSYVLCFAELGLLGFFAWLGMIVLAYRGLAYVLKLNPATQSDTYSWTAELIRFSLVGYLVCAWFLSRTYSPVLYLFLGMCASAWYCASVRDADSTEPVAPVAFVPWQMATVSSMVAAVFGVYGFLWLSE
jgi:putative inorganic carbon (hco3(-)) transporter